MVIKTRLIAYWHKLVNTGENKLVHGMNKILRNLYDTDVYRHDWLCFVHKTLNSCGMSNVWYSNGSSVTTECLKCSVLKAQFEQTWSADIENSPKCMLYKYYKANLGFEKYLLSLNGLNRKYIIKFRLSNHKLSIEKGRYNNVDRFRRYCDLCNDNVLGR